MCVCHSRSDLTLCVQILTKNREVMARLKADALSKDHILRRCVHRMSFQRKEDERRKAEVGCDSIVHWLPDVEVTTGCRLVCRRTRGMLTALLSKALTGMTLWSWRPLTLTRTKSCQLLRLDPTPLTPVPTTTMTWTWTWT